MNLRKVCDLNDAKRLYMIALLCASYGDIKNKYLMMPHLQYIYQRYSKICTYSVTASMHYGEKMVVDDTLKNYNSEKGYMSKPSRKARTKVSKDISILYAFYPKNKVADSSQAISGEYARPDHNK